MFFFILGFKFRFFFWSFLCLRCWSLLDIRSKWVRGGVGVFFLFEEVRVFWGKDWIFDVGSFRGSCGRWLGWWNWEERMRWSFLVCVFCLKFMILRVEGVLSYNICFFYSVLFWEIYILVIVCCVFDF